MVLLLAGYVAVWTLYGIIAKSSQDMNSDAAELYAWSRELALGYWKHPPLGVYVAWLWTLVFPVEDWSFYLLGIFNAAIFLWITWLISARWLDDEKRILGLALLTFVPFLNFRALVYDHNTAQLPFWAATTLFFLRSIEKRRIMDAVLTGIFAACCILTKYWSIDFLTGLGIAALLDARRREYFRSAMPWVTFLVALFLILPNVYWQISHHYPSLVYAERQHPADDFSSSLWSATLAAIGMLKYLALTIALCAYCVHVSGAGWKDSFFPEDSGRRTASRILFIPILLPLLLAAAGRFVFQSLWFTPGLSLFPAVLLGSPHVSLKPRRVQRVFALALVFPFIALLASPLVALVLLFEGQGTAHARQLSGEVQRVWRSLTDKPLQLVIGTRDLAEDISFYSPDHPRVNPRSLKPPAKWNGQYPPLLLDPTQIRRSGVVAACETQDPICTGLIDQVRQLAPDSSQQHITLQRHFLGWAGASASYVFVAVAPEASRSTSEHD